MSVAVPHVRRAAAGAHCPGERPQLGRARTQPALCVCQRGQREVQRLHLRVHDACKIVCRAGQAYPDKQQVLAAFVQPEQHGDRDICGRTPGAAFVSPGEVINVRLEDIQDPSAPRIDGYGPLARSARSLADRSGRGVLRTGHLAATRRPAAAGADPDTERAMVTRFEKTWTPTVWTERAGWAIREVSPVAMGAPSQFLQRRDIPLVVAPVRVPGPRQPVQHPVPRPPCVAQPPRCLPHLWRVAVP